jgi:alkylation response protein AidB-like acyl-CoA dehydrogenase
MPEHLSPEQEKLLARAEAFVSQTLIPLTDDHVDDAAALRGAVVAASRKAGFFAMTQPAALGGSEASTLDLTLVREALARSGLSARRHVFGPGAGVLTGTEGELRADYLEPLIRGEKRGAFAFTDARESTTVAIRDGDCWRVSGVKSYVTGGADADFFNLVARLAEPDGTPGRGAVLLVVDRDADGMELSRPFRSMDGSHHVALVLDDVVVPDTHVVGAPGEGLPRAQRQIGDVRIALAAEACGLMQFALAHLENKLRDPHHGGGTLGDREGVRLRFADARIEAYAARSMLYRTARIADAGENCINEGIATKVFATETAGRVIDAALQLEGGSALIVGHPLERLYREVRALRLAEGASDVLRLNLARGRLELDKGRL